jgi:broad specificity phosphatase PhoE
LTEIILVRHGQANSQATDEESYDRLSDLGRQQARWLGEHLRATNPEFDRVITGTLNRQVDTAREMGYDIDIQDKRFDELHYFSIAHALHAEHAIPLPTTESDYAHHLPQLLDHWERDVIEAAPERFAQFHSRVGTCLEELCQMEGRILVVTSGGVIGMVLRHALGLKNESTARVMLQILNSSVHRLEYIHDQLMLGSFNATPHLDQPARTHARTFV